MKTRLLLGLAAGALVCASCSNDELENSLVNPVGQKVTITATIEGQEEQTRSTVTDEGKFDWAEGDKINVYTTQSVWKQFNYTNENKFDGTLDSEESTSTWAVYPEMTATATDGAYTVTLPATYSLGSNTNNTNAPMVAWFDEGDTDFEFKHLGGVIRFTLTNVPTTATQFVLTADKIINGAFTLQQQDANYIIKADAEGESTTTLTFDAATEEMTFYVPLPIGTYNSMTFSLKDKDGNVLFTKTSSKAKTVARRSLLIMNPIEATVIVSTESGLRAAAAAGGNVKLGADITLSYSEELGASSITVNNTLTIDLNGKTITTENAAFLVGENGNLTINGTIEGSAINATYNVIKNSGTLTINGGTYTSTNTDNSKPTATIYCNGSLTANVDGPWHLTINDGTFESMSQTAISLQNNYYEMVEGSQGSAALNAGKFTGVSTGAAWDLYVGCAKVTVDFDNCTFTNNRIWADGYETAELDCPVYINGTKYATQGQVPMEDFHN